MASPDELGYRIRAFREMRGMSLRALGARAGTSSSLLSQLENGKVNPSIGSLRRIAQALGVGLADLFDDNSLAPRHLLRRADRPELEMGEGARKFALTRPPLHHLEVYTGEFEPGGSTGDEAYVHGDSQEIFIVIRGTVTLWLGEDQYVLEAGDSIDYRSGVPHRMANTGTEPAEVMWITSPPTPDEEDASIHFPE
ncbi:XRE family transcriptional regulator [Streptosporangium sp. NPDC051022]|uniref:helix-turn-helix domain-containing protein n=1 Tax=Streptosporangium sp. NPDC051022 TaxID=3155752 RepID=UPI003431F2E9